MKGYKFEGLRQKNHWLTPAYVTVDTNGLITHLSNEPQEHIKYENVNGYALPGMPNAHSHAFQYAMAGLAEVHPENNDANDFWSWRNKMYEIALTVEPEDVEAIAAMLYAEMLRHGYTHVAEFHYLHHDKKGKPYDNVAEMGERLIAAAHKAGIKITLVPMLYRQGGFGQPPHENQRRFISQTLSSYLKLAEHSASITKKYPHASSGYGVHSLRAAKKEEIKETIDYFGNHIPFHIHISEQLKEVEEAKEYLGDRPVSWLLKNFNVGKNFHLVHATHLTDEEVDGIAASEANVVLCPTTEGNLGDGIFPLGKYLERNGRWSIGTDSHISLNPFEELRLLDYGQRLTTHKRNSFLANADSRENAAPAFIQAVTNGRAAMGMDPNKGFFNMGDPFDTIVIDSIHPLLAADPKYRLSTMLYHFDASNIYGTIVDGRWVVKGGFHKEQLSIRNNFRKTLQTLKIRMR